MWVEKGLPFKVSLNNKAVTLFANLALRDASSISTDQIRCYCHMLNVNVPEMFGTKLKKEKVSHLNIEITIVTNNDLLCMGMLYNF